MVYFKLGSVVPSSLFPFEMKESGVDRVTEVSFSYISSSGAELEAGSSYTLYYYNPAEHNLGSFVLTKKEKRFHSKGLFRVDVTAENKLGLLRSIMIERDFSSSYDGEIIKFLLEKTGLGINTTNVDNVHFYNTYSTAGKNLLQVLKELASSDCVFWLDGDYLYFKSYDSQSVYTTLTDSDIYAWGRVGKDQSQKVYRVELHGAIVGGKEIFAQATKEGVSESDAELYKIVLNDKSITSVAQAQERANAILSEKMNAAYQVEVSTAGDINVHPGFKVTLNSTTWGINETLRVLEVNKKLENGIFKNELKLGTYRLPSIEDIVKELDEQMRSVMYSLSEVRKMAIRSILAGGSLEVVRKYIPIEPDELTAGVSVDVGNEYATLATGYTSGDFKVRFGITKDVFLGWRSISYDASEREGSVQVDVEDERGNVLLSDVPSSMDLVPYPPNGDLAESLPSEWTSSNGTLANSFNAIYGTYSMKFLRTDLNSEALFYRNFDSEDLSSYRYLCFSLMTDYDGDYEVRIYTNPWNYYKRTITVASGGWRDYVLRLNMSEWTAVGSPSLSSVRGVGLYIPQASTMSYAFIDAFRFEYLLPEPLVFHFYLSRPSAGALAPLVRSLMVGYKIGGVYA